MQEILLYLLGILIIVLGLAVSIGLHEIGHLIPAKLFGVRVSQYMIGFGKTLWSRKRGETEYGIKMIPLGGFIAMSGMYPPAKPGEQARSASTSVFDTLVQDGRDASAETIEPGEEHRTFYQLSMWKKIIIMLGGPFMNLLLAFFFFGIVLVGFGVPQNNTTLASVSECLIPASSSASECAPGDPAAPAAAAGLLPGDTVLEIDGVPTTDWNVFRDTISEAPGQTLRVLVERGDEELLVNLTPAVNERVVLDADGQVVTDAAGETLVEAVGMVGVVPSSENVRQPISEVPVFVGENIANVAQIVIALPQRMVDVWNAAFGPEERDPNGPISVVGVGRLAGEVVSMDEAPIAARAQTMLGLLGSLNIALFVFNLVPLLPLDGGHVLGAVYEGVKRRLFKLFGKPDPGPVDTAKMVPVTLAVVVLLGAMSVLLIYADLVKPIAIFG